MIQYKNNKLLIRCAMNYNTHFYSCDKKGCKNGVCCPQCSHKAQTLCEDSKFCASNGCLKCLTGKQATCGNDACPCPGCYNLSTRFCHCQEFCRKPYE